MLRRRIILPTLIGLAGAAALSTKAKSDQLFTSFAFPATGGTTARTMPDRLADIVNVKDYGAVGDGSNDDYPAVQAAFDAAFGTAGSPHGLANSYQNRSVFFPNGKYLFNSGVPTLTRVVGGYIFGEGAGATEFTRAGAGPIIAFNGAADFVMERFRLTGGGSNSPLIDLDWDNTAGGDGLHNNVFRDIVLGNFSIGILIAKSGFGGSDNFFELVTCSGSGATTGIEARAATAINNTAINGGAAGCAQGYYSSGGSIHSLEGSMATNTYDFRVDSGFPVSIIGGRSESSNTGQAILKLTSGLAIVKGFLHSLPSVGSGHIADISGGKAIFDACFSPCVFSGAAGNLYIRCCSFTNGSLLAGYSGTVSQNI